MLLGFAALDLMDVAHSQSSVKPAIPMTERKNQEINSFTTIAFSTPVSF